MLRWIIFIIIYLVMGFYALQALKTVTRFPYIYYAFMALSLLVIGNFVYQFTWGEEAGRVLSRPKSYAFGFLLAMLTFKIITIGFLFSEDLFRFIAAVYRKLFASTGEFTLPTRRRFLSLMAMGIAAIPFGALLYGMYRGKYNFQVLKYQMEFEDLPDAFDGYQITQISDIHSGSFDNRDKIEYAVDLINSQGSDAIFFTGDMVNNKDYVPWETEELKSQNLEDLKGLQKEMGFDLLLNESRYLRKGQDKMALIGVENWGRGGFKKAGDLDKASASIQTDDFKILLTHDPSHWEDVVIEHPMHYHLTLSGHTHGMQFGIEIPGWVKWSPVKWRYKYWAGIYEEMGQYINVNRGFGFLGYPGRVGIWPEITVITLKKKAVV